MRHTVVIDIPDEIAEANERWAEQPGGQVAVADLSKYVEMTVTIAVHAAEFRVGGGTFRPRVVEYHHEQMTEPSSPLGDPPEDLADAWQRYQTGGHVEPHELRALDEWRGDEAESAGY